VEKLLAKLEGEASHAEAIRFAYWLRIVKDGWTPDARSRFLTWMAKARSWNGGASFAGYLDRILVDMRPLFTDEEFALAAAPPPKPVAVAAGDPKDFDATLTFLELTRAAERRSTAEGARLYGQLCARCHLFGDAGGRVGPDLTTVSSRFSLAEQLLSTLRPNAVVSDQYRAYELRTKDGKLYSGLRAGDRDGQTSLVLGTGEVVEVPSSHVKSLEPSSLSLMPEGLLDALTLEEVGDLFAYLDTKGSAPADRGSAWRTLFDGKTLDGWDGEAALWSVEGGCIRGKANRLDGSRFLVSKGEYADFVLEFDVKLLTGNSGLQFRAEPAAPYVLTGYQADIGQSYWGALYEEGGRGMLAQPANEIWTSIVKPREFNHYVVSAIGKRLRIEVNGVATVDLEDARATRGKLGFQLHGGIDNEVWIRNVRIREGKAGK
jgi:putative heme-binding domain-containing protein